jgi:hypothetical protein
MPITERDVPSDPSKTPYPIFWQVVQDRGHQPVAGLEYRDREWIAREPNNLRRLLTRSPSVRERSNANRKGGGRG